jgi:hypothetical protein
MDVAQPSCNAIATYIMHLLPLVLCDRNSVCCCPFEPPSSTYPLHLQLLAVIPCTLESQDEPCCICIYCSAVSDLRAVFISYAFARFLAKQLCIVARTVWGRRYPSVRLAMLANAVAQAPPVPPAGFRYILVEEDILDNRNLKITPNRKVATTICDFEDLITFEDQIEFIVRLSMRSLGLLLAMRQEQYRRGLGDRAIMAKAKAKAMANLLMAPPPKAFAPPAAVVYGPPVPKVFLALMPHPAIVAAGGAPAAVVHGPPVPKAVLDLMAPPAIVAAGGAPAAVVYGPPAIVAAGGAPADPDGEPAAVVYDPYGAPADPEGEPAAVVYGAPRVAPAVKPALLAPPPKASAAPVNLLWSRESTDAAVARIVKARFGSSPSSSSTRSLCRSCMRGSCSGIGC